MPWQFISGYCGDVGAGRKVPDGCQEARYRAAEINTAVKCLFLTRCAGFISRGADTSVSSTLYFF